MMRLSETGRSEKKIIYYRIYVYFSDILSMYLLCNRYVNCLTNVNTSLGIDATFIKLCKIAFGDM